MAQKNKRELRLGEEKLNYQNCLMKIIEYNYYSDIKVEFQDNYKTKVRATYGCFKRGSVKNPYYASVYGVGVTGIKYPVKINGERTKEYGIWASMIQRCCSEKFKEKNQTYKDVTCCNEWLLFENFYEWLHSQSNFDKWYNGKRWHLDKDILVKGNKIYSPETCCLVPQNVNNLFLNNESVRGDLPIGVRRFKDRYISTYSNSLVGNKKTIHLGIYDTPEETFQVYKKARENYIRQVAQEEYDKGNITKQCYEAIMNYEIEIAD